MFNEKQYNCLLIAMLKKKQSNKHGVWFIKGLFGLERFHRIIKLFDSILCKYSKQEFREAI
jgi:hypothetical protein